MITLHSFAYFLLVLSALITIIGAGAFIASPKQPYTIAIKAATFVMVAGVIFTIVMAVGHTFFSPAAGSIPSRFEQLIDICLISFLVIKIYRIANAIDKELAEHKTRLFFCKWSFYLIGIVLAFKLLF